MKNKLSFKPIVDVKGLRMKTGMSQQKFWAQFGVTQSAGSRYENGRAMQKPLIALLRLEYPKAK